MIMFPFQFLERKIKQVKLRAVGNKLDAIAPLGTRSQLSDGVCPTLSPALTVSSRVLIQLTVYICSAFFETNNLEEPPAHEKEQARVHHINSFPLLSLWSPRTLS